ncbi:hypothetical protein F7725_006374 [Dissostichus mawsoni]|uniref:Uncharacterized protein n=1 Tax=Dissostichus mawsoni TaxID=36200 RepID=A0A7J5XTU2_DISMA|nr:hypothetical protein F7725_006374 [Dissostichus mawsoni]
MLLVLAWPMVLVFPKENPELWVVLLFCPKEKFVLAAAAPNSPVAALGVAAAGVPNKPPVGAAIGLLGPFLPAE